MFTLDRPNMAVNDPRVNAGNHVRRFQMWNTWDITAAETRQHIIDEVATVARGAPGGKLKNLVLNCHGSPGALHLGQGFNNTHVAIFAAWRGLIGKIWLPNCSVAFIGSGNSNGNIFCSNLAKQAQCYVVAATETQCDRPVTLPYDQMTSFEGLVLSYGPGGNITWSSRNPSTWIRGNSWLNSFLGRAGTCVPVPD